jgi:two-component system OmpR family response regulator
MGSLPDSRTMKILLVEDDSETEAHVRHALVHAGHDVDSAADGANGLSRALSGEYAAIILDRMLPKMDGLSLLKQLRLNDRGTPVLLLTTMSGIGDRVEGLESGADDYLVKPFAFAELLARVNAMTRRGDRAGVTTKLSVGGLEMDLIARNVTRSGNRVDLQAQEFKLLEYLMRNAGRVVTRAMLLENVWNMHFDPRTKVVETHMSRLRGKVDRGHPELIHTVRGTGYILRAG